VEDNPKKANAKERLSITPLLPSANEVAAALSVSRTTVYQMSNTGLLGPMPIALGGRKLWRYEELAAWVRAGCPARERWVKMAQEQGFGHQYGQRF
jgi:predicted DNA-binding transcriptional regulator AlpA